RGGLATGRDWLGREARLTRPASLNGSTQAGRAARDGVLDTRRGARKVTPRVVGGMAPPALAAMQPASVTFLRCEAAGGRCSRMAGTFSSVPTARRRVVEQHRHVIGT